MQSTSPNPPPQHAEDSILSIRCAVAKEVPFGDSSLRQGSRQGSCPPQTSPDSTTALCVVSSPPNGAANHPRILLLVNPPPLLDCYDIMLTLRPATCFVPASIAAGYMSAPPPTHAVGYRNTTASPEAAPKKRPEGICVPGKWSAS